MINLTNWPFKAEFQNPGLEIRTPSFLPFGNLKLLVLHLRIWWYKATSPWLTIFFILGTSRTVCLSICLYFKAKLEVGHLGYQGVSVAFLQDFELLRCRTKTIKDQLVEIHQQGTHQASEMKWWESLENPVAQHDPFPSLCMCWYGLEAEHSSPWTLTGGVHNHWFLTFLGSRVLQRLWGWSKSKPLLLEHGAVKTMSNYVHFF